MTTYAIYNDKGGVGKTHTAFHLAGAFAEQGQKVLVIDLDRSLNLTMLFFIDPLSGPSAFDVFVDDVPLEDAILKTNFDNLWLVPSSIHLGDHVSAMLQDEPDAQIRLADALKELAPDRFDVIILDCPPNRSISTRNALAAADYAIVPLEADKFSIQGVRSVLDAVAKITRAVNPRLQIAGFLVSLFTSRRNIENQFDDALRHGDIRVFATRIKNSTLYRESITVGKPITHYRPTSEQAEAFRSLLNELEPTYAHK